MKAGKSFLSDSDFEVFFSLEYKYRMNNVGKYLKKVFDTESSFKEMSL
jgi:hypothetical protein